MIVCLKAPWRASGKSLPGIQIQDKRMGRTATLHRSRVFATYTEDLKDYFSKRAPAYELDNDFHPRLAKTLVASLAGLSRGDKVLDVATGTGYVAIELARRLGSQGLVVGVDISKPMLQQAHAKLNHERGDVASFLLLEADIEQIDFCGPSFQHITCSASLPYLQDLPGFFRKARSWLSDGGSLAFNTPQEPYTLLKPLQFSVYEEFGIPAVNTGPEIGSIELIKNTLREAGFTNIEVKAEKENQVGNEIANVEEHVEAQWGAMLKMPMVDFANMEDSVVDAAYQSFRKEGISYLNAKRDTDGRIFPLPLTTLWTTAT